MPHPPVAETQKVRDRMARLTVRRGKCEEWVGQTTDNGYGRIRVNEKWKRVHRLTWEIEKGPIPAGLNVLHRCDNRRCRKLTHLFLGTTKTNAEDMLAKGRSAKRSGHGRAKLTERQVAEIRASEDSAVVLSPLYGVTVETIRRIRRGNRWPETAEQEQVNREERRRERG